MHPVIAVLVGVLVIVAAVSDIRTRRIPNLLVLPAIPIGLLLNLLLPGRSVASAAIGFGLAILIYMPLYALRGMGAGDVKLAAALGAFLGWKDFMLMFMLSGAVGLVSALFLMVTHARIRKTLMNTLYIFWDVVHLKAPFRRNEEVDVKTAQGMRSPYGVVLALGTLLLLGIRAFVG